MNTELSKALQAVLVSAFPKDSQSGYLVLMPQTDSQVTYLTLAMPPLHLKHEEINTFALHLKIGSQLTGVFIVRSSVYFSCVPACAVSLRSTLSRDNDGDQ